MRIGERLEFALVLAFIFALELTFKLALVFALILSLRKEAARDVCGTRIVSAHASYAVESAPRGSQSDASNRGITRGAAG